MEQANQKVKEVLNAKPLFKQIEEQFQNDFVASDLAEQKKLLEIKRSMMNAVPGGQLQDVIQEHQKLYSQKRDYQLAILEQKRRSEKQAWREH